MLCLLMRIYVFVSVSVGIQVEEKQEYGAGRESKIRISSRSRKVNRHFKPVPSLTFKLYINMEAMNPPLSFSHPHLNLSLVNSELHPPPPPHPLPHRWKMVYYILLIMANSIPVLQHFSPGQQPRLHHGCTSSSSSGAAASTQIFQLFYLVFLTISSKLYLEILTIRFSFLQATF